MAIVVTDLSREPVRMLTKEQQTQKTRSKPTAKQRGAISTKVRKQLHERSKGRCERCGGKAAHAAHITRRWKIQQTTVDDLIHLCIKCHAWADQSREGRDWLKGLEKNA